jgi:pilus assembly protein CpaB
VSSRRRGFLLLSLAVASGGLAASRVRELERDVEARVGPAVPVVVAARDVAPGSRIPRGALEVVRVPARYVPPDALAAVGEAAGARTAAGLARGSYVTATPLRSASPNRRAGGLRPGERAMEVAVAGGTSLATAPPGARVDVLVSSEPGGGAGRTVLALEGVELLALRPVGGDALGDGEAGEGGASASATARATLRVSVRQAVYLAAAENFAREVRLLVRPPGDRARVGAAAVGAGDL